MLFGVITHALSTDAFIKLNADPDGPWVKTENLDLLILAIYSAPSMPSLKINYVPYGSKVAIQHITKNFEIARVQRSEYCLI
jgi:hypothetical protein